MRRVRIMRTAAVIAVDVVALLVPSTALANGWSASANIDGISGLNSVSCAPGTTFCAAVDDRGYVLTSADPAQGAWRNPAPADTNHVLTSVSCVSASFCVAVDDAGNAVTYNGSKWSAAANINGGNVLTSVSCASGPPNAFCMAVDNEGQALSSTNPAGGAGAWQTTIIDGPFENGDCGTAPCVLTSVSCLSASFCVAVDDHGYAHIYNGSSWAAERTPETNGGFIRLNSVSCPLSSFCMAVDSAGNAATYSGRAWSAQPNIDPGRGLNAVSCPSGTFCAAGDSGDGVLIYSYGAWRRTSVSFGPRSVSCSSVGFCVAVGSSGDAVTYGAPATMTHKLTVRVLAKSGAAGAVDWTGGHCQAARSAPKPGLKSVTCTSSLTSGVKLTLVPVPGKDSVFLGWTSGQCTIPSLKAGRGVPAALVGCQENMSHDQVATAVFACGLYLYPPRQALHRGAPVSATVKVSSHGRPYENVLTLKGGQLLADLVHPFPYVRLPHRESIMRIIWRIRTPHGIRVVGERRAFRC